VNTNCAGSRASCGTGMGRTCRSSTSNASCGENVCTAGSLSALAFSAVRVPAVIQTGMS
jgi:hypothetical protein